MIVGPSKNNKVRLVKNILKEKIRPNIHSIKSVESLSKNSYNNEKVDSSNLEQIFTEFKEENKKEKEKAKEDSALKLSELIRRVGRINFYNKW